MECCVRRTREKKFSANLMSEEVSLSIEETNELRRKLGLKPLQVNVENVKVSEVPRKPAAEPAKKPPDRDTEEGKRLFQDLSGGGGILDLFDSEVPDKSSDERSPKSRKVETAESGSSSSIGTNSSDSSDSE